MLSEAEIDALARANAAAECTFAAGGVVVMRPLTLHASSKATDDRPRRVLHIEYTTDLVLRPGIELAVC